MRVNFLKHYKKPLKYRNKSCICRQNHQHDSIKEAHYCDQLELLKKAGEIIDYEKQVTFHMKVNDKKVCAIRVDFLVESKHGGQEVHEVKSSATMTSTWNVKRKLFEALYPHIEYIVVK